VSGKEPAGTSLAGFTITGGRGRAFPSSYGHDYYGGGVYVSGDSKLRLENCWIIGNGQGVPRSTSATFAGGVYAGGSSTHVELVQCLLRDNYCWASGGATLADNYAMMTFDRCTVTANSSTSFFGHQGGISMSNWGKVTVNSSIVWGNSGSQIGAFGAPYNRGTKATATYSDVQGGFAGTGNINANPMFASPSTNDFILQSGSPCINTGDPTTPKDPDNTRADMGAFYLSQIPASFKVFGQGCGSSSPLPSLAALSLPKIGQPFRLELRNLKPGAVGAICFGISKTTWNGISLPMPMAGLGMPKCKLLVSYDYLVPIMTGSGTVAWNTLVPSSTPAGAIFYVQAWVLDSQANSLGVSMTNAGEGKAR
jgi:hypothetical protein